MRTYFEEKFDKNKKILWLPSWYPNKDFPLYGSFVQRQAACVADVGVELCVLFVIKSKIEKTEIVINNNNFLEIIIYYPEKKFFLLDIINKIKHYYLGLKIVDNKFGKYHIVHLHIISTLVLIASAIAVLKRLPLIVTEHSSAQPHLAKKLRWHNLLMLKFAGMRAAAFITLSKHITAFTEKAYGIKNHFFEVPNVVDTTRFVPTDRPKNEVKKLLHISLLSDKHKNISGILRGVAELSKKRTDFEMYIYGDPEEQFPYKTLAQKLNILNKFVYFGDYLPHNEVAEKMSEADIFVLFSNYEGLPCVMLEAMSCGTPVVATETGGIAEWIQPEGRVVPIGDEAALVEALDALLSQESVDRQAIRSKIVKTCSYEAIGKKIETVYDFVLNK